MRDPNPIDSSNPAGDIDSKKTYLRANAYSAIAALLFHEQRYLALAAEHEVAVALRSPNMQTAFAEGRFPPLGWEQVSQERAREHAVLLRRGLASSFLSTLVFISFGVALAFMYGKVAFALPIAGGKVLGAFGAFLAGWATLFQLGGFIETISGEQLHEVMRPTLFKLLFLPGLVLATLGQLW